MPGSSQRGARGREQRRRATRERRLVERGLRRIGNESRDVSHRGTPAKRRCLSQGRPRAASRRWRSRWRGRSAARSSMPTRCRSIATCASSRRGRRRRRRRACRTGSTAMWMRRRTIRSGAGSRMSRRCCDEVRAAGSVPVLVGGTGLYFKALTQGLSAVPPVPEEIRAAVRARMEAEGPAALHAELAPRDPATQLKPARPHPDRARAGGAGGDRASARRNGIARGCRRCSRRQAP